MKIETKRIRRKKKMSEEEGRDTPIGDPDQNVRGRGEGYSDWRSISKFHVEAVNAMANELQEITRGLREVTSMFGFLSPHCVRVMNDDSTVKQPWTLVTRFPNYLSATHHE